MLDLQRLAFQSEAELSNNYIIVPQRQALKALFDNFPTKNHSTLWFFNIFGAEFSV